MFFLWFTKNKHFKQGRNLSGQIMPFLLVIIAIFLGAYFTTYRIGSVAINMTCADNAADACSLAAASHMAFALNTVHKWAKGEQKNNFGKFQNLLKSHSNAIRNVLVITKHSIAQARARLNSAKASAAPGASCTVWYSANSASAKLTQAAALVQSAGDSLKIASGVALDLRSIIKEYKRKSRSGFCDAVRGVNDIRDAAKKDGVGYALENNCVFPTLPAAKQNQIHNQVYGAPQQNNNPTASETATWTSGGYSHSMSAKVTLPQIASYELEVTKMNEPCGPQNMPNAIPAGQDPYGTSSFSLLGLLLDPIAGKLNSSSTTEEIIYAGTQDAVSSGCPKSISSTTGYCCEDRFPGFADSANSVIAKIDTALHDLDIASAAIDSLIQFTRDIVKDLGRESGKRIVSSRNCSDSGNVIIIAIDDIKFESGCIKCNVNMTNAGVPSSSGTSTSSFGGGSLRAGQPNKHYVPNVTDNSCPNHGGLTTGTTTNFGHSDGGCN